MQRIQKADLGFFFFFLVWIVQLIISNFIFSYAEKLDEELKMILKISVKKKSVSHYWS